MTSQQIIQVISNHLQIPASKIKYGRKAEIIKAKHLSIYFIQEFTNCDNVATTDIFDINRVSVLSILMAVTRRLETDKEYRKLFNEIKLILTGIKEMEK